MTSESRTTPSLENAPARAFGSMVRSRELLWRETSTLGVRGLPVRKWMLERRVLTVARAIWRLCSAFASIGTGGACTAGSRVTPLRSFRFAESCGSSARAARSMRSWLRSPN